MCLNAQIFKKRIANWWWFFILFQNPNFTQNNPLVLSIIVSKTTLPNAPNPPNRPYMNNNLIELTVNVIAPQLNFLMTTFYPSKHSTNQLLTKQLWNVVRHLIFDWNASEKNVTFYEFSHRQFDTHIPLLSSHLKYVHWFNFIYVLHAPYHYHWDELHVFIGSNGSTGSTIDENN